jgi:hypothetical protein
MLRFYGIDFNDGRLRPTSDSKQRRASFRLPTPLSNLNNVEPSHSLNDLTIYLPI